MQGTTPIHEWVSLEMAALTPVLEPASSRDAHLMLCRTFRGGAIRVREDRPICSTRPSTILDQIRAGFMYNQKRRGAPGLCP